MPSKRTPPRLPVVPRKDATFTPPPESDQDETSSPALRQELEPAKVELPPSITPEEYENLTDPVLKWRILVEAFRLNRRTILSLPGVTAVDIGYRMEKGVFQDDLALRIHVEWKLPDEPSEIKDRPYFPKRGPLPAGVRAFRPKVYEVPTDVIEGNYGPVHVAGPRPDKALEKPRDPDKVKVNRRRRLNPLVGGISIGSPQAPSGTLGALVWDNRDGSVCILSNWHILSGDLRAEAGTPCFQPGRLDHGRSGDVVAHLKRWSFDHQTDAAIAELTGSRHYCAGEILDLPQQIIGETSPYLGMLLQKSGRSTGFTWGFVDGLYFSTTIEYSNGIVQVFEDQIHIAPVASGARISEPGDSGAIWVAGPDPETTEAEDENRYRAVGLHFAGDLPHSAFGEYALANPMSLVMRNLDVSFRPRFLEIRDEDVLAPPPLPLRSEEEHNGAQPFGIVSSRRLRGSGGHGDPIVVRPTGG